MTQQKIDTKDKLVRSRKNLLDLTTRNRLLNFPPGATGFKEKDSRLYKHLPVFADIKTVWNQLVEEDKSVRVISIEEDDEPEDRIAAYTKKPHLCAVGEEEYIEKRLQKIHREQNTMESSTGDSAFFLAIGFLEWKEAPPKDTRTLIAPLLLLHVRLSKSGGVGRRTFSLEMDSELPQGNPCLREKLRSDHDLILPSHEDVESPEDYFRTIETAIKGRDGWSLHRTCALGFFDFAGYRLWLDLDEKEWPSGLAPSDHQIVRDLLDQRWSLKIASTPSGDDVARQQQGQDLPIVMDADSTQYAAIMAAAKGQSMVIIGPPGSGKSQTITNLIATFISDGKKVLFVAQKLAALQVVQRRLEDVGLAPFCLPLHSDRSKPVDVHNRLRLAGSALSEAIRNQEEPASSTLASRLNDLADSLSICPLGDDESVAEILQRASALRAQAQRAWGSQWSNGVLDIKVEAIKITPGWKDDRNRCIREWAKLKAKIGTQWEKWQPLKLRELDLHKVQTGISSLSIATSSFASTITILPEIMQGWSVTEFIDQISSLEKKPLPPDCNTPLLNHLRSLGNNTQTIHELEHTLENYHRYRKRATDVIAEVTDSNANVLAARLTEATQNIGSRFSPSLPICTARELMATMRSGLALVQDLLSSTSQYPTGTAAINSTIGSGLTWTTLQCLSSMTFDADMQSRPTIHMGLARYLAENEPEIVSAGKLCDTIVLFHNLNRQVQEKVPSLLHQDPERLRECRDAVTAMIDSGFLTCRGDQVAHLHIAAARHHENLSNLRDLYLAHEAPLSILAPTLDWTTCQALASTLPRWDIDRLRPPNGINTNLIQALSARQIEVNTLKEASQQIATMGRIASSIKQLCPSADLTKKDVSPQLASFCSRIPPNCGAQVGHIRILAAYSQNAEKWFDGAEKYFGKIVQTLHITEPISLPGIERLTVIVQLLRSFPQLPGQGLLDKAKTREDLAIIKQTIEKCAFLSSELADLDSRYAMRDLPEEAEISEIRRAIRSHHSRLFRGLSGEFRIARRKLQVFVRTPMPRFDEVVQDLDRIEVYLNGVAEINSNTRLQELLGPSFQGMLTDWQQATSSLEWFDRYLQMSPANPLTLGQLQSISIKGRQGWDNADTYLNKLRSFDQEIRTKFAWWPHISLLSHWAESASSQLLQTIRGSLHAIGQEASLAYKEMAALGLPDITLLNVAAEAIKQTGQFQGLKSSLAYLGKIAQRQVEDFTSESVDDICYWYCNNLQRDIPPQYLVAIAQDPENMVLATSRLAGLIGEFQKSAQQLQDLGPTSLIFEGDIADQIAAVDALTSYIQRVEFDGTICVIPLSLAEINTLLKNVSMANEIRVQSQEWAGRIGEPPLAANVDLLQKTLAWSSRARELGAGDALLQWCLESDTANRLRWWQDIVRTSQEVRRCLEQLQESKVIFPDEQFNSQELLAWHTSMTQLHTKLAQSIETIFGTMTSAEDTLDSVFKAAAALVQSEKIAEELRPWETVIQAPPTSYTPDQVAAHRRWIASITKNPSPLVEWLLSANTSDQICKFLSLKPLLNEVTNCNEELIQTMGSFGILIGGGPQDLCAKNVSAGEILAKMQSLESALPQLLPWADFLREQCRAAALGLAPITKAALDLELDELTLLLTFDAAVATQRARYAWENDDRLAKFRGAEFNQLRQEFSKLDASRLGFNRRQIIRGLQLRRHDTQPTQSGRRPVTPDMHVTLKHEENKQKRHMPIRKLVERAGPAMTEFCPCWLMTPTAVAQFLPPGKLEFDVVIMDEASQLPPEDAWGAIARGSQLIVVGDPRQMPPSDFFYSSLSEEDEMPGDEDEFDGSKLDSILDSATGCLPQNWLRWHYRSRHQSLIAPANHFSYDDRLVLFPSSYDKHEELGIRYQFIPNAVVTTGRVINALEANAVVNRLIQLARNDYSKPESDRRSIGVVAMNSHQQEAIQELLDERRSKDPSIDRALVQLEMRRPEPLFIKNLENIQGDERDVILISCTYGPNVAGGTPTQRFGPINFDGGEKRFNVLITRSKLRMEIFSSIRSEQILITDKKAGVRHFHYFLRFAETGQLIEEGAVTNRGTDSPFEDYVMAILKEDGYLVEPQVGVAGYFIDLAIRDPRDPSRFILGIECDGAPYHSSKAARDRDRLREQVLKERGWRLYRIWSTDWFSNHAAAKEELLVTVARVCEGLI